MLRKGAILLVGFNFVFVKVIFSAPHADGSVTDCPWPPCAASNECEQQPCLNNGTCLNIGGSYTCKCPEFWEGQNCENDVNECLTSPCSNNRTCINLWGGFYCSCPLGFTGHTCMEDVNECVQNPCADGEECLNTIGAFACVCVDDGKDQSCNIVSACSAHLGMENGDIPNTAITASSTYSDVVRPEYGRIRTEIGGGAWCPKSVIDKDSYEYLQVDLGGLHVITMVGVQGRFGNGQGREYAKKFRLEYENADGQWLQCTNKKGDYVFDGNHNTYMEEVRAIVPSVVAKKLRFIPVSDDGKLTVCMRVEVYGCPLQVKKITMPLTRKVSAFSVTGGPRIGPVKDAIVLPKLITNVGDDYIEDAGIFVCRIPGVYLFIVSIAKSSTSTSAQCHVVKNADRVIQVSSVNSQIDNGVILQQGSNSVILELGTGDAVYLGGCSDVGTFADRGTFSGSLLSRANDTTF